MQRFDTAVEEYMIRYSTPEDPLLHELYRETYLKALRPDMVCDHLQGKLLEMLCKMMKPLAVLEIGTFTGYSTICLAKGCDKKAVIHTIDTNDEIVEMAAHYFNKAGLSEMIVQHIGDAIEVIPELGLFFDLVYIDGDKKEYPDYFKLVKKYVKQGGFIIADNVLWWGKVDQEPGRKDAYTKGIQQFNEMVANDNSFEQVFIPLRDGLMLIRKL